GPCSELFFDLGESLNVPELRGGDNPENNGDRFMELGNIVFTQFERSGPVPGEGTLTPLPQKNIDFGGGLERLVMVKEGVNATLDTSLFMPQRMAMRELAGFEANERLHDGQGLSSYQQSVQEEDLAHSAPGGVGRAAHFSSQDLIREKRIADHLRACCFIIADGITPSNEKQGYILRRILRRAYRDGVKLGFNEPFLYKLVEVIVDGYAKAYPELETHKQLITDTVKREESDFDRVLVKGMEKLGHEIRVLEQASKNTLAGAIAFDLHSTHGLPIDVTRDVLSEHNLHLDEAGFQKAFDDFREQSRKSSGFADGVFDKGAMHTTKRIAKPTQFVGYDRTSSEAKISSIMWNDQAVHHINEGAEAVIVLNQTPFYAESGGQVGDTGVIEAPSGRFVVKDCIKMANYHLHVGVMESGTLTLEEVVTAKIDADRRARIIRNHSATHLMHAALRKVLGDHVHQKGSLVNAEGLRFDFSHPQKVSSEEIAEIERRVNTWIRANDSVETEETSPDSARERGALMFFGEKYGEKVRMLTMGSSSCELCGGTHVARTGDIGAFRITSESSVASGVRRIE
ncbi:MAG: alanine--tRNA ligase, partial [Planctomycetes bacterium]|nr:alanine--tRNA ligase [Planctomycetota bacterium]